MNAHRELLGDEPRRDSPLETKTVSVRSLYDEIGQAANATGFQWDWRHKTWICPPSFVATIPMADFEEMGFAIDGRVVASYPASFAVYPVWLEQGYRHKATEWFDDSVAMRYEVEQ